MTNTPNTPNTPTNAEASRMTRSLNYETRWISRLADAICLEARDLAESVGPIVDTNPPYPKSPVEKIREAWANADRLRV